MWEEIYFYHLDFLLVLDYIQIHVSNSVLNKGLLPAALILQV